MSPYKNAIVEMVGRFVNAPREVGKNARGGNRLQVTGYRLQVTGSWFGVANVDCPALTPL
jgi:hypothetical protein